MSILRQIKYGLHKLIHSRRSDQDVAEEVEHFFDQAIAEKEALGIPREEAQRVVYREFGNQTSAKEAVREYGWEDRIETLFTDIRFALRRLKNNVGFSTTCVLTLALGIGATTTIFSLVNGILIQPLPYPDSERLVALTHTAHGVGVDDMKEMSPSLYFTYREENQTFEDIALWTLENPTVSGLREPEEVTALFTTNRLLPLLHVTPVLGRSFSELNNDDRQPKTVILTHGYWESHYGRAHDVLGQIILVDGEAHEIIGVLPASFTFMDKRFSILLPLSFRRSSVHLGDFSFRGIGRLKPGVTIEQANSDIRRMLPIAATIFPPSPGFNSTMLEDAKIAPNLKPLKEDLTGNISNALFVLMGALTFVFLIACANVTNLLLVRAEGRQQELFLRKALGASINRIARELLVESILLGLMGGAVGLLLAYPALQIFIHADITQLPRVQEISIDSVVLIFTITISLLAGISFGLVPVWRYAKPGFFTGFGKSRTHGQSKDQKMAHSILIVTQFALALILLIGAGLMLRTSQSLLRLNPGFSEPQQLQVFRISIPNQQVQDRTKVLRMQNDILDRISEISGVSSAAFINHAPFNRGKGGDDPLYAEDRDYPSNVIPPLRRFKAISPGFFSTIGSRFMAGRDLTWKDIYSHQQVALISENLAKELWGSSESAIGKRIRSDYDEDWFEIIGVVSNLHDDGMEHAAPSIIYRPILCKYSQSAEPNIHRNVSYLIRSSRTNSTTFIHDLRQAVAAVNPDLPLANISTLEETYSKSMAQTSFTMVLMIVAGSMSLILGVIGIYGVISYSVSQRIREIGIRIALGAPTGNITKIFVRNGILLSGAGIFLGLIASFSLTHLMQSLLFGVSISDPATYIFASTSLLLAAFLASYLPAQRAAKVNPSETLRAE